MISTFVIATIAVVVVIVALFLIQKESKQQNNPFIKPILIFGFSSVVVYLLIIYELFFAGSI